MEEMGGGQIGESYLDKAMLAINRCLRALNGDLVAIVVALGPVVLVGEGRIQDGLGPVAFAQPGVFTSPDLWRGNELPTYVINYCYYYHYYHYHYHYYYYCYYYHYHYYYYCYFYYHYHYYHYNYSNYRYCYCYCYY